jgi:hypothetical protein
MTAPFTGSYRAGEVEFLLTPLPLQDFVDVPEKERLIQSGQRHYSEMLSPTWKYSAPPAPSTANAWRATACTWPA